MKTAGPARRAGRQSNRDEQGRPDGRATGGSGQRPGPAAGRRPARSFSKQASATPQAGAPLAEPGCYRCAILIASDRAAQMIRPDQTGPLLEQRLKEFGFPVVCRRVTSDERGAIVETLRKWADDEGIALIITSGGTGLGPRDLTPEATLEVIERRVPGMEETMRQASLRVTPHAMLSRAVVGTRGRSLIINLPGSPRAALDNLEVVQPALLHALELISGRTPDP